MDQTSIVPSAQLMTEEQARAHKFPAAAGRTLNGDTNGESSQRYAMEAEARARKYERKGELKNAAEEYATAAHHSNMAKHDFKYYGRTEGYDRSNNQVNHMNEQHGHAGRLYAMLEDHRHEAATQFWKGEHYEKAAEQYALHAQNPNHHRQTKVDHLQNAIDARNNALFKNQGDSDKHLHAIEGHHKEIADVYSSALSEWQKHAKTIEGKPQNINQDKIRQAKSQIYGINEKIAQEHEARAAILHNRNDHANAQKARDEAIRHRQDALKHAKDNHFGYLEDEHKRKLAELHRQSRKHYETLQNQTKIKEHQDAHLANLSRYNTTKYQAKQKMKGLFFQSMKPKKV